MGLVGTGSLWSSALLKSSQANDGNSFVECQLLGMIHTQLSVLPEGHLVHPLFLLKVKHVCLLLSFLTLLLTKISGLFNCLFSFCIVSCFH